MADIVFTAMAAGGPIGQDYLPANYDLVLYRGDYLPFSVTLKDNNSVALDLTGHTAKCSIRQNYDSVSSFDAECTVTGETGNVDIVFPSDVTQTLSAGSYIWDFQITDQDGNRRTYFTGDVTVYGDVSS